MLGKDKLKTIEVQISKALIDSYISHDESVAVNNVLREHNEIKEERKYPETSVEHIIRKQGERIVSVVTKTVQTKIQMLEKLNKMD